MGAFAAVIGCLVLFSFLLYQALKRVSYAYREATGTIPTMRTHAPWLRSMRGERPEQAARPRVSGPEQIVVICVIVAAVAFEIWFFLLSGSSIGGGSGR